MVFTPVRSSFPPFNTTMSGTIVGTLPLPALTVMWNTHWPGVVEMPVLVAAVITGTNFTPAWPTSTRTFDGAAAFGPHLEVLSVTAISTYSERSAFLPFRHAVTT